MGKITVINNLALSPLLYVASVIHTPDIVFKEVKASIHDLICDGNEGLKLMDIETKVKSLKAVWVKRFLDLSAHRWKAAPGSFYK